MLIEPIRAKMEKYFDIPDVNLPRMKLYDALYRIWLLYDRNGWNSDVQHQVSSWMYVVKNKLVNNKEYWDALKRFLESICKKPNEQPKNTLFNFQTFKWDKP